MHFFRTIIRNISPQFFLWVFIIIFSVYFSFVAFNRHDNFHSRRLDMGNMEQTVWNLTHGNGFTLTDPMGTENISRLAVHADFLLVGMVPFYMLWQDAKMLILVQTIVVCLGALPLYWIAKYILRSAWLALLFALAYLLYPPLQHIMLHDFHAVALATTFLLFAYWFMLGKRYVLFVLFALLAGFGKETVWITVGLMGLYIAIWQRKKVLGGGVAIAAFFIFYYLFWHAIPAVTPNGQHFALQYLSEYGDNTTSVVWNVLRNPGSVLYTFIQPDRLEYYYRLLLPVGFLPLFSPFVLVFAVHSLVINTLSSYSLMRQIDYQYTSDIIPFLFISAVYGYQKVVSLVLQYGRKKQPVRFYITGVMVLCMALSSFLWGELPLTREDRFYYFIWPLPEKNTLSHMEDMMLPEYTVSATNDIGSHFAKRMYLYNFPVNAMTADYALVRLGDQYAWPSGDEQQRVVMQLLQSPDHTLIARDGNFYAFERKNK
ncbi:DUF2079 domain-containing protein [Patescibacteria group bacterium]|nr:DUF2079 domain-containing protein [Patescibacteria group bacterium]